MSKSIYILSGLGADKRIFQRLDLSAYHVTHIEWITPFREETIENYAARLLSQITIPSPVIIGLSFGGIIAVEIAKQIDVGKLILISSAKTASEIPFYFRWAGKLGFHKLLPTRLLKCTNFLINWFFGASSVSDRQLLKQILADTDPIFFKWAIDQIVRWKNKTLPNHFAHIHGTTDRILPVHFVSSDIRVIGGGHLMVFNKSGVLSEMIKKELYCEAGQ